MAVSELALDLVRKAALKAYQRGALEPVALDVSERVFLTDVFLVLSADSQRGVKAAADAVDEAMVAEGIRPLRREGADAANWVLMDYDHFVVHIFLDEQREFYGLERLWGDCPSVDLQLPAERPAEAKAEPEEVNTIIGL
ncbi:ribosome silencing factor [Boudabousia tangfeifanii]|uniref:Ribosomal silencing factor RsfS n=1 Tax=Boudabousia tangfeifanii TaxID=1912795 RepID=A0A1D9MKB6_9ACTO|nr:ribosome silencing factor [Boudabousia tangfeifanii]AOZ72726.1 ribosome silencing factor [Boudabousia tangfeifanii]